MVHSHTVHLPLGALLIWCTMCGYRYRNFRRWKAASIPGPRQSDSFLAPAPADGGDAAAALPPAAAAAAPPPAADVPPPPAHPPTKGSSRGSIRPSLATLPESSPPRASSSAADAAPADAAPAAPPPPARAPPASLLVAEYEHVGNTVSERRYVLLPALNTWGTPTPCTSH